MDHLTYKPLTHKTLVIVNPDDRLTSDIMTSFEYTEIVSQRAKQIQNGGVCMTDVLNLIDPIAMAEKELRDRKCPLKVVRHRTDKIIEIWSANELALPNF